MFGDFIFQKAIWIEGHLWLDKPGRPHLSPQGMQVTEKVTRCIDVD